MRFWILPGLLLFVFGAPAQAADRIPVVGLYTPPPRPQLPDGGYLPKDVPFPAIADPSTLDIVLERSPCFGDCPIYRLDIRGDGSVFYEGQGAVAVTGHHRATIPHDTVERLLAAFREVRFFSLLVSYSLPWTDGATNTLSLSFDGHTKTVEDYFGLEAGMPEVVDTLEKLVDTTAGADRWIKGNAHSMADLRAEGWDFRNSDDEHQRMVVEAARYAKPGLFNAILDAGARPIGWFGCEAAFSAIARSDARAVEKLMALRVAMHWEPPPDDHEHWACNLLGVTAEKAKPEILALVLARHPDLNRADKNEGPPLIQLVEFADRGEPGSDVMACAEMLLAAGADPRVRDSKGQTALGIARAKNSPVAPVLERWMEAHPQPR